MSQLPCLRRLPALFGGAALFSEPKYIGTPTIPDRVKLHARLDEMLDARRLSNDGPFVKDLEERLSEMNGGVEAVAVCNATVGMQLLIKALGLTGEIILPSFTFIATAHACFWEGLYPVFVDVNPTTHVIDADLVAAQVTERTAAILGVHLWGRMCPVRELERALHGRGIPLIFDAAHSFGCTYRGAQMGTLGTASVVSFHATKFIQSLEGGAILTPDPALAKRLRLLRNFGFSGYDQVVSIGTNAKLDEFSAAMAIGSIEGMESLVARNRANRIAYERALASLPGLSLYEYDESEANNFQYLIVVVDPSACPYTRDNLVKLLHAENVVARRYFHPGCHRSAPYSGMPETVRCPLPATEKLADTLLALPTGEAVEIHEINAIGDFLRDILHNCEEINRMLKLRQQT